MAPNSMPNPSPVEGRCNAKRKDGLFCANKPHDSDARGGNGRCKFHGGCNTGPKTRAGKDRIAINALKHGLYAKALRSTFQDPSDRKLWDVIDRSTSLSQEIALWRMKLIKWQKLLGAGVDTFKIGTNADGSDRTVLIEELIARGQALLTTAVKSQHDMHPESAIHGNLQITISVEGGAVGAAQDLDVPDLETDAMGSPVLPRGTPIAKGVTLRRKQSSPLADLEPNDE